MKQLLAQGFTRQFPPVAVSLLVLLLLAGCSGGSGVASPSFPAITLTRIASGFVQPVHITHAGDGSGRLFVVERGGVIRIVRDGAVLPTPFFDISGQVQSAGGEQGLLSVAFPPDFAAKQYFYVDYTNRTGIGNTIVARYPMTANPDIAASTGGVTLLNVSQPFANHNGGQLAFGPDGLLYIALGDGGSAGDPFNNAQNLATGLGKILRLDTKAGVSPYALPTGNPFGNEIWAYGLRNPWRFSFDRATGDLYIADVGQNLIEEVNFQPATSTGGENYGWNIMEGTSCFLSPECDRTDLILPVTEYSHADGNCSVTGGFVYRGSQYPPLQGTYLYADFCSGRLWGLKRSGAAWENRLLLDTTLQISSFGEDEAGNLYLADLGAGDIYKVDLP